ncbi:MAG: hypothetical protein ACI9JN_001575 [Bacteroidia bacterium]|jgi:hypothetical protein
MLVNPSILFKNSGKKIIVLKLTSSNGCSDSIKKEIDLKVQSKANYSADDVCENDSVLFMNLSQDATSFNWKFGDGESSSLKSPKHPYNIGGITLTYIVTLVAIVPDGCSDSITMAVTVNANPNSDFYFTTNGEQVNFNAVETNATQYQWTFGDGEKLNTTNPKNTYNYPNFPAGYTACLKVLNNAGCFSETCKEISTTSWVNNLTKPKIIIYPNPNSGNFTIEITEPNENLTIEIFNQLGQMVHITKSNQFSNIVAFNLANGIYLVKVTNGDGTFNQRVIVGN